MLFPLLTLCCSPGPHKYPTIPSALLALLFAAERLSMPTIAQDLRARWGELARADPLRTYFAAVQAHERGHCKEEPVRLAARCTLRIALDREYLPEMDTAQCPALPYLRLTSYHDACRAAARSLIAQAAASASPGTIASSRQVEATPGSTVSVSPTAVTDDMLAVPDHGGPVPVPSPAPVPTAASPPNAVFWLSAFASRLSGQIDEMGPECEGLMSSGKSDSYLLEEACAQGQWCPSCDTLARGLACVGQALRRLPATIDSVSSRLYWMLEPFFALVGFARLTDTPDISDAMSDNVSREGATVESALRWIGDWSVNRPSQVWQVNRTCSTGSAPRRPLRREHQHCGAVRRTAHVRRTVRRTLHV